MRHAIALHVTLEGPFLTKGSSPSAFGLDAVCERDEDNRLVIPRTLLAGKLREAWRDLSEVTGDGSHADEGDRWLGTESRAGTRNDPARRRLIIPDLVATTTTRGPLDLRPLPRVKRNEETAALEHGMLALLEPGAAAGEAIRFAGQLTVFCDRREVGALLRALRAALGWITSLGSQRSVGYGRLRGSTCELSGSMDYGTLLAPPPPLVPPGDGLRLPIRLRPNAPFCITGRRFGREKGNLFESLEEIPGNVIKGALAATWAAALGAPDQAVDRFTDGIRRHLQKHFNRIRFTHARPSTRPDRRAVQWPLSLVESKGGIEDVMAPEVTGERLAQRFGRAPAFVPDWKGDVWGKVPAAYGFATLDKTLRIRTAIDYDRRKAAEGQLFAYLCVVPRDDIAWLAEVDLSVIPDADERLATARELMDVLGRGPHFLGKTKAETTVELVPALAPVVASTPLARKDAWIVTLQTHALLCNPREVEHGKPASLRAAYASVLHELSDGLLRLDNFFAQQGLYGGEHLHARFGNRQGRGYIPYFLTEAGSTFLLASAERQTRDEARACLQCWLDGGLPLPQWARALHGDTWDTNPYLPAHGFGEIAVNLKLPECFAAAEPEEDAA